MDAIRSDQGRELMIYTVVAKQAASSWLLKRPLYIDPPFKCKWRKSKSYRKNPLYTLACLPSDSGGQCAQKVTHDESSNANFRNPTLWGPQNLTVAVKHVILS